MACRRSGVQSPSTPLEFAKVAELVYALVSKTSGLTAVRVQLPPLAFFHCKLLLPLQLTIPPVLDIIIFLCRNASSNF